ncbi:MAG: hypothetical protein H7A31_04040 [Thermotogae bacterium]|nr:hypothetical protein [Thermotogota bacterium]MCP5465849.1 hypothetical protein [Thermotogota bacterium]
MKKIFITFLFIVAIVLSFSEKGVGVYSGYPENGAYGRLTTDSGYLDGILSYNLSFGSIGAAGDYMFKSNFVNNTFGWPFETHFGGGVFLRLKNFTSIAAGLRFPLGIDYNIPKIELSDGSYFNLPITVFAEIVPSLKIIDSFDFEISISAGGVYWF